MLPSSRRIPKDLYIVSGKYINSPFFNLKISQIKTLEPTRFAFSVSKKVTQSAVLRNKIRRRGYSILKKNLSAVKNGHLLFFQAKKGVEKLSFKDFSQNVEGLLHKASVI